MGVPVMEALGGREVDAGMKIMEDVVIVVAEVVKELDEMEEAVVEDEGIVVVLVSVDEVMVVLEWGRRVLVRWLRVLLRVVAIKVSEGLKTVLAEVVVLEYSTEVRAGELGKPVE